MGVPRLGTIYGIELGPTLLGGVTAHSLNNGVECQTEPTSGEVYPRANFITAMKPGAAFSTTQLKTFIDACTLFGVDITTLTGRLKLYIQKMATAGARASGSVHRRFTINQGVILPRSISCRHQQDAMIQAEAIATYDGTNNPIVEADTVAVPTGLSEQRYSLGPVTIGSVTIDGHRSVDIDLGLDVVREGAVSEIWDKEVSIRTIAPKIRISGVDYEWLKSSNIPFTGKAAAHADTKIYFRKKKDASSFETDVTAAHVKLTTAGLCYIVDPFKGDGNAPGEITLALDTKYDGTNAPIIVSTAIAVT